MGIISDRQRYKIGGLRVVVRTIGANLFGVYKRYGCVVIVRARKRKRKRKGVDVLINTHYFISQTYTPGDSKIVLGSSDATQSRNARRTRISEWAVSVNEEPIFPIVGVVAVGKIRIAGEERDFTMQRGKVQKDFIPPSLYLSD